MPWMIQKRKKWILKKQAEKLQAAEKISKPTMTKKRALEPAQEKKSRPRKRQNTSYRKPDLSKPDLKFVVKQAKKILKGQGRKYGSGYKSGIRYSLRSENKGKRRSKRPSPGLPLRYR